ncbi:Lrp/AsnC family transcriptional regulator [Geothrix sp. PMB-07]|uniref:Lrp/AsnC family transcriptional regulator n=1 Tax=Geothrix sp. PMB-07 TaxID=3068640 RepID=UPI002741CCC9|nr:Lrp/AsnC family transcriptional regulator [Geothrix sp. PMB-07]WLT30802.1 Lrp/AsnC family transcriptional regulator [Geothrix sp. PMB-07]
MKAVELDAIDHKILDILQREGRLSNQDLAERVALSPAPCLRRVRALEKAGVIRQYAALLDPRKVGLGLTALITVKLEKRGAMPSEAFAKAVRGWPEVVSCYSMTGDTDYLLWTVVEDLDHYNRFLTGQLLKLPYVVDVKSNLALEAIKLTTSLPLNHLGLDPRKGRG